MPNRAAPGNIEGVAQRLSPWFQGRVQVHDLPPTQESVRSDVGRRHRVVLATYDISHVRKNFVGGPAHLDSLFRQGQTLVYSADAAATPTLTAFQGRARFASALLEPATMARACDGVGLDYDATEFVDYRLSDGDLLLGGLMREISAEAVAPSNGAGRLYGEHLMQSVAVHLALRYTAGTPRALRTHGGLPARALRHVEALVRSDLAADLSLDDLAAAAGYSVYHFAREFRASTGETPHGYVRRLRVEEGARLLERTPWSVAAVAAAVGYESPSRFAQAFRRHHGASPSDFRRDTQR